MKKLAILFILLSSAAFLTSCQSDKASVNAQTGLGGSMARFTLTGDHLYIAENNSLEIINVTDPRNPTYVGETELDVFTETIFPYKDMLFMGTPNGMLIYSIANPEAPYQLSFYQHILGCDPVVVQDDIAYVSVNAGTQCRQGSVPILEAVDVSDPSNPEVLSQFFPEASLGLGVDDSVLFHCRGDYGLALYKTNLPDTMYQTGILPNIHAWDVIPFNNILLVIGQNGLYQYDYSDPNNLALLSQLPQ